MNNRILDVAIVNHRLDPVETELRIFVKLAEITPATEVRGRLLGPRCAHASTIEIAYSLREVARSDHVELRVLIPEPSWWDPQTPFLYEGHIELWQDGAAGGRVPIRHGIRRLQLTAKGLLVNGAPCTLRGKMVASPWSEADARQARVAGLNAVVLNVAADTDFGAWNIADRLGFFVLGTSADALRFVECGNEVADHPSAFGWIFNRTQIPTDEGERPMFYGVNTSAGNPPPAADFLCCHESELAWFEDARLPKLVVTHRLSDLPSPRPDVIGWIAADA